MTRITTLAAALAVGLMSTTALAQQQLKFGHVGEPGSLFAASADHFAEIANEKLGGTAEVVIFGSSQLGKDEELLQKLKLGTVQFALPSSVMSSVSPEFGLFEMPYLVQDRDHMQRIQAEIVEPTLMPAAEAQGYKIIGLWENGFRHITNNVRPINVPDDLDGIKLRTPKGEWRVRMFESYGANPTPMAFSEVFTALQTGVIDGQENPLAQIASAKFQEVQKYLSMTGHVYTPAYVLVGKNAFEGLDAEVQTALEEAAAETQAFVYEEAARLDEELLGVIQDAGVAVNEADKQAFIDASKPIYETFAGEVEGGQEMVDKAQSLADGS